MQIGAALLCKGAKVAYESIEYGGLSIGDGEDTRARGPEGRRETTFRVAGGSLGWQVAGKTSSGLGSQVIGYRVRVREMKCKGATAAKPRAKVQK